MGGVSWAATHVRLSPWPATVMCRAAVRPLVRLPRPSTHTGTLAAACAGWVVACPRSRCEGCVQTHGTRTQSAGEARSPVCHGTIKSMCHLDMRTTVKDQRFDVCCKTHTSLVSLVLTVVTEALRPSDALRTLIPERRTPDIQPRVSSSFHEPTGT